MAFADLRKLFDDATRSHPDLMEPYVNRLGDSDSVEHEEIMRSGLRETIKQRYPISGEAA